MKLSVNIDHIATLRNARHDNNPDLLGVVKLIENCKEVSVMTMHLREDRRHIMDKDIFDVKNNIHLPINLEMAATEEMLKIALKLAPKFVTIVPEKREELTTEGGLDVISLYKTLSPYVQHLKDANIKVALFVEADIEQLSASNKIGANIVEIHTGTYSNLFAENNHKMHEEIEKINHAVDYVINSTSMECQAGHGLNYKNVLNIVHIKGIEQLNIGHSIIADSVTCGIEKAIRRIYYAMHYGPSNEGI